MNLRNDFYVIQVLVLKALLIFLNSHIHRFGHVTINEMSTMFVPLDVKMYSLTLIIVITLISCYYSILFPL